MPRWQQDERAAGPVVQGFGPAGFSVDGRSYAAVLLTPQSASLWAPPAVSSLGIDSFAPLLELEPRPEFLILGTGRSTVFPPRSLVAALEAKGIGIEVMDSRAAARTWGMLRTEERWIAAALMPL